MIALLIVFTLFVCGVAAPAYLRRALAGMVAAVGLGLFFRDESVIALALAGVGLGAALVPKPSRAFTFVVLGLGCVFALNASVWIVSDMATALFILLASFAGGWVFAAAPEPERRLSSALLTLGGVLMVAQLVSPSGQLAWTASLPVVATDGEAARLVFLEASGARSLAWWQPVPLALPALLFIGGASLLVPALRRPEPGRRFEVLTFLSGVALAVFALAAVLAVEGLLSPMADVDANTVVDSLSPASVARDATAYLWPESSTWTLSHPHAALLLAALLVALSPLLLRGWCPDGVVESDLSGTAEVRDQGVSLWPAVYALAFAALLGLDVNAMQGLRYAPEVNPGWIAAGALAAVAGVELVARPHTRGVLRTILAVGALVGIAALLAGVL